MNRPKVLINCAVSREGNLSNPDGTPVQLSNLSDFEIVHRIRNNYDAILIGGNTLRSDNPSLKVKPNLLPTNTVINHPLRIVISNSCQFDLTSKFFSGTKKGKLILTSKNLPFESPLYQVSNIMTYDPLIGIIDGLSNIYRMGVESIMVEGGAETIKLFLVNGLVDKIRIAVSPISIPFCNAPNINDTQIQEAISRNFQLDSSYYLGDMVINEYESKEND